jgi:hypothetical protein
MRKCHAAVVCAVIGVTGNAALASDLEMIRSTQDATVYIDRTTMAGEAGKKRIWSIWDHKKTQVNVYGEPYGSAALHNEYDCQARTVRLLEIAEYTGPRAGGDMVRSYPAEDSTPRRIAPQTVAWGIMEAVCEVRLPSQIKLQNRYF